MSARKYRLPDVLGGSEVEVLSGMSSMDGRADVLVPGVVGVVTLSPASILVVVPPPLPEEPPVDSFVYLASYYGVYERAGRGWIATNEITGPAFEWDALVRLNSGDAPVRLIPAPEPVELPWGKGGPVLVAWDPTDSMPAHPIAVAAGVGQSPVHINRWRARQMARALNAAADKADAEATS